jgi:hypothetical protein
MKTSDELLAALLTAGLLAFSGCAEDGAETGEEAAEADTVEVEDDLGEAIEEGAEEVGEAVEEGAEAVEEAAEKANP